MRPARIQGVKIPTSVGLYPELINLMDEERGDLSRSDFIGSLIYNYFFGMMPADNRILV